MVRAGKVSEETSPSDSATWGTPNPLHVEREGNSIVSKADASMATLESLGTGGVTWLVPPVGLGHPNVGLVDQAGVGAGADFGLAEELATTGELMAGKEVWMQSFPWRSSL